MPEQKNPVSVPKAPRRLNPLLLAGLVILAAAAYFAYDFFLAPKPERKSYAEFYSLVADGRVGEATLSVDGIRFTVDEEGAAIGGGSDARGGRNAKGSTEYVTDNPASPTLKEYLLLHGVKVKEEKDATAIISFLFDALFYLFFFGIILVAFRKFISPNSFRVVRNTGVKFADVVGMDGLKRDMAQVMESLKDPVGYAAKGIRAPKGILLEGAPGNGKTLFARALAGEAKVNFIPAKATDFESMFMAIGPMKVKLLFRKARKRAPCIVFIDEFDGIGTRRN
ncbi:MAG: AAA family ATPase, partial [Treponema sp.]|nr:AAA family ATPase [Treponema sp.]